MNGNRIREARKKKGYTLKQVADATGYTVGHISQIERDLKAPSLTALRKIAACLECSEVWLIMGAASEAPVYESRSGEDPKATYLIRRENRIPMKLPEIDVEYSIFTPSDLPQGRSAALTGMWVRLKAGAWITEQMISHGNYDESLLLLKGELEMHMDNSTYTVRQGDSFYIPSGSLHNYLNISEEDAVIIVYFSQLVY